MFVPRWLEECEYGDEGLDWVEGEAVKTDDVILWTQQDCPLCGQVKAFFGEGNYTEKNVSDLITGVDANDEALAQLAMQNMQLPLVQVAGEYVDVEEVLRRAEMDAA